VLNRYIGGGRKRDPTTWICVVSRIRDAEYGLLAHGNLARRRADRRYNAIGKIDMPALSREILTGKGLRAST